MGGGVTGYGPTEVHVSERAEVREWFRGHSEQPDGVWFVYTKGKERTIDYDDVVEEALCCGWVDSRSRSFDPTRTMLYVAPRKPNSAWSASNVARVERLISAGLMTEPGLTAVAAAKADGRRPAG
jgi:uncharacterized protein YdeI (YjbR/CyaY-like superfamily)